MENYRDHFDTRPDMYSYRQQEQGGFTAPLIALGVIVVLFVGIFLLSSGTSEVDINAGSASQVAPAAPAAQ